MCRQRCRQREGRLEPFQFLANHLRRSRSRPRQALTSQAGGGRVWSGTTTFYCHRPSIRLPCSCDSHLPARFDPCLLCHPSSHSSRSPASRKSRFWYRTPRRASAPPCFAQRRPTRSTMSSVFLLVLPRPRRFADASPPVKATDENLTQENWALIIVRSASKLTPTVDDARNTRLRL